MTRLAILACLALAACGGSDPSASGSIPGDGTPTPPSAVWAERLPATIPFAGSATGRMLIRRGSAAPLPSPLDVSVGVSGGHLGVQSEGIANTYPVGLPAQLFSFPYCTEGCTLWVTLRCSEFTGAETSTVSAHLQIGTRGPLILADETVSATCVR